eukprot:1175707-Prorocentrum_minimum.AAC.1
MCRRLQVQAVTLRTAQVVEAVTLRTAQVVEAVTLRTAQVEVAQVGELAERRDPRVASPPQVQCLRASQSHEWTGHIPGGRANHMSGRGIYLEGETIT